MPVNTESPVKIKFATIALVALILFAASVWYISCPAEKNPNPEQLIKKGAGSSSPKALASKGEVRLNSKDGLKYVWIRPGIFMMGCSSGDAECGPEEKPPHQVTITKGFWMGQTEVTVGAFKRFAGATGRQMPDARPPQN